MFSSTDSCLSNYAWQTCSFPNQLSFSFHCGYPSAGLSCIYNSGPYRWFLRTTTGLQEHNLAMYSHVSTTEILFTCVFANMSSSNVCGSYTSNDIKHFPRKSSDSLWQNVQHTRGPTVLCLHRVYPDAHRTLLVWLDVFLVCALDCASCCGGMRYDGDLFYLPCCVQLSGRYVPPIRQLCACSTVLL
jgi:hypothetical protein